MTTLLYTHSSFLEHDPGAGHPECPDRMRAVMSALDAEEFSDLERRQAPQADLSQVERVHDGAHVKAVLAAVPGSGHVHLDPDTVLCPRSGEAALRAAGAAVAAVDAVLGGEADKAFLAVRPPGHHAEANRAMGFCLFNNVAIAAMQAQAVHGIERVGVVDFDVHHGNGTQSSFWDNPGLFYASTHQSPNYPGTGLESEHGGHDNIVNVELAPGTGSEAFRRGMERFILPAIDAFKPELLLISAGFDAHGRDPLAALNLTDDDYDWATRRLLEKADAHSGGRVISTLEGGYDLTALASSVSAHVRVLMGN